MSITTPNINQFGQTPVLGDLDLMSGASNVLPVLVDNSQATALVAGQAVKLVDSSSPMPTVVGLAANTDSSFGFIVRTLKDIQFAANRRVEIALAGSVMQMASGAAIARGAKVEVNFSANTVITSAGTNPVVGFALDKATASGQLIRVYIITQDYMGAVSIAGVGGLQTALNGREQVVNVTATLAQINAGLVLVPAVAGQAITVTDITERVVGAFTTTTSVDVQSGTTAVKVSVAAVAGLTNGAVLKPGDANITRGVGYATPLPTGEGLAIANTGTAAAGGTSIQYTVSYVQK